MRKQELIDKLERYASLGDSKSKGEKPFVLFLIRYLKELRIDHDEKYDFYHIFPHIPQIVTDAHHEFRTSKEAWICEFRSQYEKELEHPVPHLTDVGFDWGVNRALEAQGIAHLLKEALGTDVIEHNMNAYCNAQTYFLQQVFDNFLRRVYRKGMFDLIESAEITGMGGTFGQTELRTFSTAGRIMFTFARKIDEEEVSISFLAEDGDPKAYSAGIQSIQACLVDSLSMINDVIDNWPEREEEQKAVFGENRNISIGV